jgi:hypothetical protein
MEDNLLIFLNQVQEIPREGKSRFPFKAETKVLQASIISTPSAEDLLSAQVLSTIRKSSYY